jgi:hypothetical protein
MINMKLIKYILLLVLLFPIMLFGQENPLEGKKLKDLEIEIIYKEGKEMNVDSRFSIWTIVTMENGKPLKGLVREGSDPATYDVKISGAKMNQYNPYNYDPYKYCEGYDNKELTISVSAKGVNTITKTLNFKMNCTPDPAIIAQKKKEKEEELQRVAEENAKAKLAKEKLDAEKAATAKLAADGELIGLTIPESTISSVEFMKPDKKYNYKNFDLDHDLSFSFAHINTVEIDILFLGSERTSLDSREMFPSIYKFKNDKLESLDINTGDFPLVKNTAIRDAIKVSDTEIVVVTDNGFMKMVKTPTGYKKNLHLHAEKDLPLCFTDIVSLGNGKCASIGYARTMGYRRPVSIRSDELDDKAVLLIWDYNTNDFACLSLGNDISEESVLACDNNGNLIFSLGKHSVFHAPYPEKLGTHHKSTDNSIRSINVLKTFKNKQIEYNWIRKIDTGTEDGSSPDLTFVVSDIIIEDNDDIVFVGVSHNDSIYSVVASRYGYKKLESIHWGVKTSSNIGVGRLSSDGNVKNWKITNGINVSLWGGSEKGNLEVDLTPGKIYYSAYKFPKLISSPDGKGYIIAHSGADDKFNYPDGYLNSANSENSKSTSTLLFVYLNKRTLDAISFDLFNTENNYPFQSTFLSYNSSAKEYTMIRSKFEPYKSSVKWKFKPNFNQNWLRKPLIKETRGENNGFVDFMTEFYAPYEEETNNTSSGSNSSNNYSSSNSSVSSEPEIKLVQVYVDPNGKGTVKIYWKQDGSSKKFTLTGSRRAIGYLPEGTKLSYSASPDHNKKNYFYTVPSGKSSVSVDL